MRPDPVAIIDVSIVRIVLSFPHPTHLETNREAPTHVLGQDDFESGEENRGCGVGPDTFRWPHAIAECGYG